MKSDVQNIIIRQVFDLKISKNENFQQLQKQFSQLFWDDIQPVLDEVLAAFADPDFYYSIEKLEIDLGHLTKQQLSQPSMTDEIRQQLFNTLRARFRIDHVSKKGITLVENQFSQWLYYIRYGRLPAAGNSFSKPDWQQQVIERLATEDVAIRQLNQLIRKYPFIINRLVYQYQDDFLIQLVEVNTTPARDRLLAFINKMKPLFLNSKLIEACFTLFRQIVWQQILEFSFLSTTRPAEKELTQSIIQKYSSRSNQKHRQLLLQDETIREVFNTENFGFSQNSPLTEIHKEEIRKGNNRPDSEQLLKELKLEQQTGTNDDIFLNYAGLVLLHPFFPGLFKKLGFLKDGKFIGFPQQCRAAHLLHWLGSGEMQDHEFEMVMAKTLCGIPLAMPLQQPVTLSKKEINEITLMVGSAIEHWTIVGNISLAGLREGFLSRAGKLQIKDQKQHLYLEQNAIDILLDKLPWPLSMIKLSWMPEILRVNWR